MRTQLSGAITGYNFHGIEWNDLSGRFRRVRVLQPISAHPGLVLVGIGVTRHEEVVRQVGLLHRGPIPLLHSAREVVLVLHEPLCAKELHPLVVPVGRSSAHLCIMTS